MPAEGLAGLGNSAAFAPIKTHPLYVYYHTHWDREWYLPFREYQHRLLKVVDTVLEAVEQQQLPCFTLDGQTVLLEDYLEFRPQNKARLEALVHQEKISIGPWYIMPDEFLVGGESLIRNLQRGLALSQQFGETTFTGYLPDTFGHSADIPMLLQQFGIESAIVWRGVKPQVPLFLWASPSGDQVRTYHLSEGYFQHILHMGTDQVQKDTFIEGWLTKVSDLTPDGWPILFPVGADHLGLSAASFPFMTQLAPKAITVTTDKFMQAMSAFPEVELATLHGELYDFEGAYLLSGVFSSRMALKQQNRRLEWRLTRQLEQLWVWKQILGLSESNGLELDFLWKTLLLNHPHDSICGCSVDSVHRENHVRFDQIDQLSTAIIRDAHQQLCTQFQPARSILCFNLSDTSYTGVIEIQADYSLSEGSKIPQALPNSQVLSEETILDESYLQNTSILPLSENQALRRRSLVWVSNLPAHGTLALDTLEKATDTVEVSARKLENKLIRLEVSEKGVLSIHDKIKDHQYTNLHQPWRNAEQGDSYNAAPVPGTKPEQAVLTACQMLHNGPLHGALRLTYHFQSIHLVLETDVIINADSARVEFETRFINNTPDHKIQIFFAAGAPITEVTAEGHFSPVTRQYDPNYRIQDAMPAPAQKELRVQCGAIQRFIGFQNQTLITEGLTEYEVEGPELKLTLMRGFGMLSRNDTEVRGSHAGPPLPTPEGQCLNEAFQCRYAWLPGFDVVTAFQQADWFYGALYGLDRQANQVFERSKASQAALSTQFYSWDNTAVQSTASVPGANGQWQLRLSNPTAQTQPVMLQFLNKINSAKIVNLNDKMLETLALTNNAVSTTILPYQIQTLQLSLV